MFLHNKKYLDIKYLNQVSPALRNFKWKANDLAVCSCPICGDSERDKYRARGYFYFDKGKMLFKCHNCAVSMAFYTLLNQLNPRMHGEYMMDSLRVQGGELNFDKKPPTDTLEETYLKINVKENFGLRYCVQLKNLSSNHPSVAYMESRKIPRSVYNEFLYTNKFQDQVREFQPEKKIPIDDPRIVVPFLDPKGNLVGFQGRALSPDSRVRYITICLSRDYPLWYGLRNVNPAEDVYIVEGVFDAVFIPNSIAVLTSSIAKPQLYKHVPKDKCVFLNDSEPRNRSICKIIKNHILDGNKVCILPSYLMGFGKDINSIIQNGVNVDELNGIITRSVSRGPEALLKFSAWKRVSNKKQEVFV